MPASTRTRTPRTHEQTINTSLAEILEGFGRTWAIRAEDVGRTFVEGGRPELVAVVAPEVEAALIAAMRAHPLGRDAAAIGDVVADEQRFVQMTTAFGGGRIVDWLAGEQLPRIC